MGRFLIDFKDVRILPVVIRCVTEILNLQFGLHQLPLLIRVVGVGRELCHLHAGLGRLTEAQVIAAGFTGEGVQTVKSAWNGVTPNEETPKTEQPQDVDSLGEQQFEDVK